MNYQENDLTIKSIDANTNFNLKDFNDRFSDIQDYINGTRTKVSDLNSNKVDKASGKGLSTNDFSNTYKGYVDDLVNSSKTLKNGHIHTISDITNLQTSLNGKVDKVSGKGLSTNDFNNDYRAWLDSQMTFDTTVGIASWYSGSGWHISTQYGDSMINSNLSRVKVQFENYECFNHWKSSPSDFLFYSCLDSAFQTNPNYPYMIGSTTTQTVSLFVPWEGGSKSFRKIFRN